MWYFSWILGLLLACSLGIINVLRLEAQEAWDKEHVPLDPTTQLFTKEFMWSRLKEKIENSKRNGLPFSVMTLNVKQFSENNQFQDYETDTTLHNIVGFLNTELRQGVDLAARMNAHTLLIVMPGATLQKAQTLAQHFQDEIAIRVKAPRNLTVVLEAGAAEYVHSSSGYISVLPTTDAEVQSLLKTACKHFSA